MLSSEQARSAIVDASVDACRKINEFSKEVLHTRGGRIGSGMGTLLEALWGYFCNHNLSDNFGGDDSCELAWMYGHEYNDFALVISCQEWNPDNRSGELLRVEMKSMVVAADESKAHFDQIQRQITEYDLLAVLVWDWTNIDKNRVCPQILDHFIGPALPIAKLRDKLHIARGGSFVDPHKCPDGCSSNLCKHAGEPLNEQGKRERYTGPETRRVSTKVSYAANFGGMVRMLKTNSKNARDIFQLFRRDDDVANAYISFIHRNFPKEELSQYSASEWKKLAKVLGYKQSKGLKKVQLVEEIRKRYSGYRGQLRNLDSKIEVSETTPEDVSQGELPLSGTPSKPSRKKKASSQPSSEARDDGLQKLLRRIRDDVDPS